eukprot:COSAG05_NODE_1276_length_5305_cov_7.675759_9_plen_99_part_00
MVVAGGIAALAAACTAAVVAVAAQLAVGPDLFLQLPRVQRRNVTPQRLWVQFASQPPHNHVKYNTGGVFDSVWGGGCCVRIQSWVPHIFAWGIEDKFG